MSALTSTHVVDPTRLIPDLLQEHPAARLVLDRHGLAGCGGPNGPHETLRFFARAHGIDEERLLLEIDEAIQRPEALAPPQAPSIADAIYRPFFVAAIAVALTAGATWGAWILWNIGFQGSFVEMSVHTINAHGEAQIYGWVGLFIMGFAYQAFPRMWQSRLPAPRLALAAFLAMVVGILLRTIGLTTAGMWGLAVPVALAGGVLQIAASSVFAGQLYVAFQRSSRRFEPYIAFITAAVACFVLSTIYSTWHTWNTMRAADAEALVSAVATYQFPLRDIQVHGMALLMILGVSMRMLPPLFDLPQIDDRRAWRCLGLLVLGLVIEIVMFLAYRLSGNHALAAFLLLAWVLMTVGAAGIVLPWKPWRPMPTADRSGKFVRMAYLWLGIALILLLAMPGYQALSGIKFSHAYFGATRHAITVGFVSLMIMGMAAKVVPTLNGVVPTDLSQLWGPFLLVNTGCTLRVILQILTDWNATAFTLIGISGTLEVIGLTWWGLGLVRLIVLGMRASPERTRILGPRPDRIEGGHVVADVVDWYPAAIDVLVQFGFAAITNPLLRRTMARQVTIERAARLHGIEPDALLKAINQRIGGLKTLPTLTVLQPGSPA